MERNERRTGFVILLLAAMKFGAAKRADAELRLIQDLLTDYDPDVGPTSGILQVTMDITLHQIIEVDVKNQAITTNLWQRMYWNDDHFSWNSSNYGGLDRIRISANRIWRPDVTLINDITGEFHNNEPNFVATVYSNGNVRWLTPRLLVSSCTMDVLYFPWDHQTCTLQYTSWDYDNSEISLNANNTHADNTDYVANGEWELVALPVRRRVLRAPCCAVPFTNIEFDIEIRRRARYYVINVIFPSMLITAAGMLVFCLPPESGEKVSLSVTILLATTIYQLLLADRMPVQSMSIPIIGRYIIITQILLALSTAFTVLVLDIHHQGVFGNTVPPRLRKVVELLATVLLLKGSVKKVWYSPRGDERNFGDLAPGRNSRESQNEKHIALNSRHKSTRSIKDINEDVPGLESSQAAVQNVGMGPMGQKHYSFTRTFCEMRDEDQNTIEWVLVAKVFDRLFFVLFAVCFLVSSFSLLAGNLV